MIWFQLSENIIIIFINHMQILRLLNCKCFSHLLTDTVFWKFKCSDGQEFSLPRRFPSGLTFCTLLGHFFRDGCRKQRRNSEPSYSSSVETFPVTCFRGILLMLLNGKLCLAHFSSPGTFFFLMA